MDDITNYDDLTVPEAKELLAETSTDDLRGVLAYEKEHKDRVTLVEWIEDRLEAELDAEVDEIVEELEADLDEYLVGYFEVSRFSSHTGVNTSRERIVLRSA